MARKSTIVRLPAPARAAIDGALKEGRKTLDEILDHLKKKYPDQRLPSRSSIARYKLRFDERQEKLGDVAQNADALAKRFVEILEGDDGAALQRALADRKVVRIIVLEFSERDPKENA